MAAKVEDLLIEQGATFKKTITISSNGTPIDLTGFVARGQIRIGATSPVVVSSFTFTFVEPRTTTGQIIMELPATITETMPTTGDKYSSLTKYQYDVEAESPTGIVYRLLNGGANVSPEQTR